MDTIKTIVLLDPEMRERIRPLLKRQGMTISSFMRKTMADYIEANECPDKIGTHPSSAWSLKDGNDE